MAIQKSLLIALNNDFDRAFRQGEKDKAVAVFSALVGMAIAVTPAQSGPLYAILSKATTVSFNQLNIDKEAVLRAVDRNRG